MSLIINSAFSRPTKHWVDDGKGGLEEKEGRRPANYAIFDARHETRQTIELELVNTIRSRVDSWRAKKWPGVTIVTRKLLEHWHDREARGNHVEFYFCQLEAVETLIWWVEADNEFKQGITIPRDEGQEWERLCNKMATGAGKTAVMAMIITWQALNALSYPNRNKDFSRCFFVVAPGLTVKERLQTLQPSEGSYYDEFNICPSEAMRSKLNQAEVVIENWHTLMPLKETQRSVVRKGKESDEAFARRVLGKIAARKDIVVINDEAHHAYRKPPELKISKKQAEELGIDLDEATKWIEGLDRIHKTRRIQRCFDLSATPFAPTGKKSSDAALFDWVVSDFGLYDAIESGLVKTPRLVVRDDAPPDAKTLRPKLSHIYRDPSVSEDLNRKAEPHENLPTLVQSAYTLLGADWKETRKKWSEAGHHSPPVMLTVCNRTETAARIENYFNKGDSHWPELREPNRTLRVDSKVLEKAEIGEASVADKSYEARLKELVKAADIPEAIKERLLGMKKEELLREIVDNVGKRDSAGQDLQNVISVAMLSEGWDAKNVTHIMGLRAFTSQLLCEQVVGRGLRRVSHDKDDETGFFSPEYVNVFGIPLLISETGEDAGLAPTPKPMTQIEALPERAALEIKWPNVLRVETVVTPQLTVDWNEVSPLEDIDPSNFSLSADMASALGVSADVNNIKDIDLEKIPSEFRMQRIIFQAARKAVDQMRREFKGTDEYLAAQLVRIMETFLKSDLVRIPSAYYSDPLRRRIIIAIHGDLVVEHVLRFVKEQNEERLTPVFDEEHPIGSTGEMRTWYTAKPCFPTRKSHINYLVGDSSWEGYAANVFEKRDEVIAYAKNDHLGFQVYYMWSGSRRRYVPDFLVRLGDGTLLIIEIKGTDSPQSKAKLAALEEWVRAVNEHGGFGFWAPPRVAFEPSCVQDIIDDPIKAGKPR